MLSNLDKFRLFFPVSTSLPPMVRNNLGCKLPPSLFTTTIADIKGSQQVKTLYVQMH